MCEIRPDEGEFVTTSLDDIDWRYDVLVAGEDGFRIKRRDAYWLPGPLFCNHVGSDEWELPPVPEIGEELFLPEGTVLKGFPEPLHKRQIKSIEKTRKHLASIVR